MAFPLKFGVAEYDTAVSEIEKLDDRGAAIVATSLMEEYLVLAIKSRFKQSDAIVEGEFMKGYGPLASLKSRIDLGFFLGFYDQSCRRRLIRIKEIRNKFAHSLKPLSFEHQEIRDVCQHLPSIAAMEEPWQRYKNIFDFAEKHQICQDLDTASFSKTVGAFVSYFQNLENTDRNRFMTYTHFRAIAMIVFISGRDHLEVFREDLMHL